MKTYFIEHRREGSINMGDRVKTQINGTYQDAVNAAHAIFQGMTEKTCVTVHSDVYAIYFYHMIKASGEVQDRNTNSGVAFPASYAIKFERNAYRDAA